MECAGKSDFGGVSFCSRPRHSSVEKMKCKLPSRAQWFDRLSGGGKGGRWRSSVAEGHTRGDLDRYEGDEEGAEPHPEDGRARSRAWGIDIEQAGRKDEVCAPGKSSTPCYAAIRGR